MRRADLAADPLRQFGRWFEEAAATGMPAPEAVALATATPDGRPSVRMVLLKGADERGFRFHTNYESRKGQELEANPQAALLFHWPQLGRQVRVEGSVSRLPASESEAYFQSRSREAQLSAAASRQSEVLASRAELERRVADLRARYGQEAVPRPPFWGGFALLPLVLEFWQHRENRLHDRFRYRRDAAGAWVVDRLSP